MKIELLWLAPLFTRVATAPLNGRTSQVSRPGQGPKASTLGKAVPMNDGIRILSSIQSENKRQVEDVRHQLEWFTWCLKSFIHGRIFNMRGFDSSRETLKHQFSHMDRLVETFMYNSTELYAQLTYAEHLFEYMVACSSALKKYSLRGSAADVLVHRVTKLNLRLVTLFDPHDAPIPSITQCKELLERFAQNLEHWQRRFESLTDVPVQTQKTFENHLALAIHRVDVLAGFVEKRQGGVTASMR